VINEYWTEEWRRILWKWSIS